MNLMGEKVGNNLAQDTLPEQNTKSAGIKMNNL